MKEGTAMNLRINSVLQSMKGFDVDLQDDHIVEAGLLLLIIVWCVIVSVSAIVLTAYIFIRCKRRAYHPQEDSDTGSSASDRPPRLRGVITLVTSILVRSHNFSETQRQVQETDAGAGSSSVDPFEAAWKDVKEVLTRSALAAQNSDGTGENHNVSSRAPHHREAEAEMTELIFCEEQLKAQDFVDLICCSSIQSTSRSDDLAPEKAPSSISRSDNKASSTKQREGDREKIDGFAPCLVARSISLSRARSNWFERALLSRSHSVPRRESQSSDLSKTLPSDTDLSAGVRAV
ncbi:hypothetical protein MPTK1_8g06030 [Marchantia polymorpha subsp. ruderalis]|uniref:Uncharacterized protein n=1 Tax=Marchantia polymorpha TaxID=3197 RepID=A0A2R6XIQ1_MARPO|nr:hypothetical protein MARPO_0013s0187 [Marchantia polymorpha]BBN18851.1 hypothetical protein Mp_8g06030 [Marchantia polymorpha subsp. ruderalis]|eukprot:PTQ45993.1 hypothetical protein MARPO_0013s0187 [Marchantia polymorpha]